MNQYSVVTVDMSADEYEELLSLLSFAERCACSFEYDALAHDFGFYRDLLESNRR